MERADGIPAQVRPRLLVYSGDGGSEVNAVDGEGRKFLPGLGHDKAKEFIGAGKVIRPERLGMKRQAVQARPDQFIRGQGNGNQLVFSHRGRL